MVRINTLGAQLFLPLAAFGSAVLIPLYKTSGYLAETTTNADVIMTYSMSNVASKDPVLWVPWVMFIGFTLYALWAVFMHLKSYAAFRMLQEHRVEVSQTLGLYPMALFADLSKDEDYRKVVGDTHGFLLWIKAAASFFSPWHMHSQDLAFIRLCRASYERILEVRQKTEACEDTIVHDDDVQEPVHPWWQSPEDTPACVNSVYKPRGVLLGKSNWAYRKSCGGVLPRRNNAPCSTSAHNYVVEYRNAGDVEERKGHDVHAEVSKVISLMYCENEYIQHEYNDTGFGDRLNMLEGDLKMLFPESFMKLVPVYYYRSTDEAIQAWDETVAKIHSQQSALDGLLKKHNMQGEKDVEMAHSGGMFSRCMQTRTTLKIQKLNDSLTSLIDKKKNLEAKIVELRREALERPADTAAFAIFSNQADARQARHGEIGITPTINMVASVAPGADEVNFQALWSTAAQQRNVLMLMIPVYVLLILFPIGAITGALSNFTVAVCGGTPETNDLYWSSYCDSAAVVPTTLLTSILPVALSAFWDTFFMPLMLYMATQRLRIHSSFTKLDQALTIQLYVFSVVNTFLMGVVGGAALSQIGQAFSQGSFSSLLGESLPGASNFFLNYVAVHCLFTNLFRFVWPHDGTVLFQVLRLFRLAPQPYTDRESWIIRSPPSFRGARHYASFLLIFIIGLSYSVISPLVLPLCWGFFLTSWIAWRYNCIHFYEPCYNSLGAMWKSFASCYIATLYIATFFVACLFISKSFFWEGGLLAILNAFIIYMARSYMHRKVTSFLEATPLQLSYAAPTIQSPDEIQLMYTPPCLRPGAVGWFPEQGKIWEKYGLPKFLGPDPSKKLNKQDTKKDM
ncbi:hypothetical protein M9435_002527 [Picochlorum sp. BPE23]|nr:hypothetical protein M9435_002527 [Picochlorum sp. BPE23]